jgi:hypothetical protein
MVGTLYHNNVGQCPLFEINSLYAVFKEVILLLCSDALLPLYLHICYYFCYIY